MTKLRIVGLCGPKYSGKDTAGEALAALNNTYNYFRLAKMAEGVKNIVGEVFGWGPELYEDPILKEKKLEEWPFLEPRWPLMDIANWMRDKYGGDVWSRRWERLALQTEGWGCHVITDMRFPEELAMLQKHEGLLVYIRRPAAEEALRIAQKQQNQMALNRSESHYAMLLDAADVIIENDGPIHKVRNEIHAVTRNRYGHWSTWPDVNKSALHTLRTGDFNYANQ